MKILNLYAGIGGNRKLWGNNHDITAIEINPDIAKIYKDFFPNDNVIITDAHQYLLEHYKEYDFIWSSPPCPTHSRMRQFMRVGNGQSMPCYPDMKLYQEIIFLKYNFKGFYAIENVIPYYDFLIKPTAILNRHCFWSNFEIDNLFLRENAFILRGTTKDLREFHNIDIRGFNIKDKRQVLRNCVNPEIGKYILNQIMNIEDKKQLNLFEAQNEIMVN